VRLKKSDLIDAGVTFIGITGPAASGKTEAALVARKHFVNSLLISRDRYVLKIILEDSSIAKKVFGRAFSTKQELIDCLWQDSSVATIRALNLAIMQPLAEIYQHDIGKLLELKSVPNPIITEGALLNATKGVWDLVTDKVQIDASPEIIASNTINRDGSDLAQVREQALSPFYDIGAKGTPIENTSDLITFKKNVLSFCKTINVSNKTL